MLEMAWDLHNMDRLFVPSFDKPRSFSTSTPFVQPHEQKLRSLSVSISSCTAEDSGLGASMTDVSLQSFTNTTLSVSQTCPAVTVSVCQTPTCGQSPHFNARQLELCVSPVSTKRFSSRRLESDYNSRRSFQARRSLDSDFSPDCSFDANNDTLNSDEIQHERSFDTSFARKLNLDLDIYDSDDSLHEASLSTLSTVKEAGLASEFDKLLQKFSPAESDRLIGRKMGRDCVDILTELKDRNISCVSGIILSFLEPQDLCRMCTVSRQWKEVCETDKVANQRRRRFLRHQKDTRQSIGKENAGKRSMTPQSRSTAIPFQTLPVVQASVETPVRNDVMTTTQQFICAASRLKNDERLQKCPRCRKPAKVLPVQDRGNCQNDECKFDYCTKCLCEFHGSKDCAPIATKKTKTDSIGTRKSKKNLKRL